MTKRLLVMLSVLALFLAACAGGSGQTARPTTGGGATTAPSTGEPSTETEEPAESEEPGESPAEESPAGESPDAESPAAESPAAESPAASPVGAGECVVEPATEVDDTISGTLTLAGWSAGNVEDEILNCVLQKFQAKYPNVTVSFEVIAGEYPAVMATRLGSGPVPDLFYVNQAYSQDWIDQGLLAPLDQMATDAGFDMTAFYPNYLSPFQRDGQTYAFPKDSSVLGMQTNDQMLTDAGVAIPTTTEELVTAAQAVKDAGVVDIPMCFAGEWQRAGAFVHGFGGSIVDEGATTNTFSSPETLEGLQWYLDQYEAGLAATPADLGAGWCGEALGRGLVAFAFEGNWVGPAMETDFPDIAYTVSPIPAGPSQQATLSFTVGYGISPQTANQEASWALLSYLTGQEGMQEWVNGGLVLPARTDVTPQSERQQTYAPFAEFAFPGEGVTPQWGQVSSALNGALAGEATGSYNAQAVVDATVPAVDSALGQ